MRVLVGDESVIGHCECSWAVRMLRGLRLLVSNEVLVGVEIPREL